MNWGCVSLLDLLVELALAPIWPNPSPNAVKDFLSLENTLFARFMMRAPIIRRSTNQPKPANYPTKVLNGATPHPAFGHPSPPGSDFLGSVYLTLTEAVVDLKPV